MEYVYSILLKTTTLTDLDFEIFVGSLDEPNTNETLLKALDRKTKKFNIQKLNELESYTLDCIIDSIKDVLPEYRNLSMVARNKLADKFYKWILNIEKQYHYVADEGVKSELKNYSGFDIGITLLKELHEGVTYQDLYDNYKLDKRVVRDYFSVMSPSFSEEEKKKNLKRNQISEVRIGNQLVKVDIDDSKKNGKKKIFRTINTVHPVIMQMNLMQVATLLHDLELGYNHGSDISVTIGTNIWYQLSDYAKKKLKGKLVEIGYLSKSFLENLENNVNDESINFSTERKMTKIVSSTEEGLVLVQKQSRICTIYLENGKEYSTTEIHKIDDETISFVDLETEEEIIVNINDIDEIEF